MATHESDFDSGLVRDEPASAYFQTITVRCDQYGPKGRYSRGFLLGRFGPDKAMPYILNAITEDCASNAYSVCAT